MVLVNFTNIVLVVCFVLAIFATIFSCFYRKPVRILLFCFFVLGAHYTMVTNTSMQKRLGYGMLLFTFVYALRGVRILAYQSRDIFLKESEKSSEKKRWMDFIREMPSLERFGKGLCFLVAFGSVCFLFRMATERSIWKILLGIPFVYILYLAFYCVLGQMISPLFRLKKEKRIDRLQDMRRINLYAPKNYISNVYLFFEEDQDVYALYQNVAKKLEDKIGYTLEYEVCTSILGVKFIKKMPQRIYEKEEKQQKRIEERDFQKHYYWDNYFLESGISSSLFRKEGILSFLFPFAMACGVIGIAMLGLHFFVDILQI